MGKLEEKKCLSTSFCISGVSYKFFLTVKWTFTIAFYYLNSLSSIITVHALSKTIPTINQWQYSYVLKLMMGHTCVLSI